MGDDVWWHPGDPPLQIHPEPTLYLAARRPPELEWSYAWQRLAVTLLACRSSPAQVRADSARLFEAIPVPAALTLTDLGPLLRATGARQGRALVELGHRWPEDGSWPTSIEGWLGVGPMVLEHYLLLVWGRRPEQPGWASPLLTLSDAMGLVPWLVEQAPAG